MANSTIKSFLKQSYPRVIIPANLLEYIREIVAQCEDEVSWVMEVTELKNYDYEIESVFIPRQKVHSVTTEFDASDIAHLMENEPTFNPEKWRGWGHSHVNMPVKPSSQDEKQMIEFANECDFFIGMIHNKDGEIFCWVVDSKRQIFVSDVEVCVVSEYKSEVQQLLKERVGKLVENSHKRYGTSSTTTNAPKSTSSLSQSYVPFIMRGYSVCYGTKVINDMNQFGYEVEGVFFPISLYPSAELAIKGYEKIIVDSISDKSFEEMMEDEMPPLHELDINDELEDYNRSIADTSVTF